MEPSLFANVPPASPSVHTAVVKGPLIAPPKAVVVPPWHIGFTVVTSTAGRVIVIDPFPRLVPCVKVKQPEPTDVVTEGLTNDEPPPPSP